jgi:hypothetical protein
MALLTAYVGTLGQAIAGQREFGGIMSKPWRMVTLHLGSWIVLADLWSWRFAQSWQLTILDLTHLVIVAGCLQTIAVRLVSMVRRLNKR